MGPKVKIGNFVETKNAIFAHGAAITLSYLGDAMIGEKANIGAGTITCNYDGFTKSTTIIGDQAFIAQTVLWSRQWNWQGRLGWCGFGYYKECG